MADGGVQSLEMADGKELSEEILTFAENMFLFLNKEYGPGIGVPFSSEKESPYYTLTVEKTASLIYEASRDMAREICRKNYPFRRKKVRSEKFCSWLQNTYAQYHNDCGVFMNLFSSAVFVFEAVLFTVERGMPTYYLSVATLWSLLFAQRFGEQFVKSGGWEVLKSNEKCALLYDLMSRQSENSEFDTPLLRKIVHDSIVPVFYKNCSVEGTEWETETRGACGFSATATGGSYPKKTAESFSPRKNKSSKKKERTNEKLSCPVESIEMKTETRAACGFGATGGAYPKKSAERYSPRKNKSSKIKARTNETLSCPVEGIEMETETRGAYPKKSAESFSPGKNKSSKEERGNKTQTLSVRYDPFEDFSIKESPDELLKAGFPGFVLPDEHFNRKLLSLYAERSISTEEVMRRYNEHNGLPAERQTGSARGARARINPMHLRQSGGAVFSETKNRKSPQKSKSCVSGLTESFGQLGVSGESSSKVKADNDKTESLAVDSSEESERSEEDENTKNESEESSEENTQQRSPRKKKGGKKKGKSKGGKKKTKK